MERENELQITPSISLNIQLLNTVLDVSLLVDKLKKQKKTIGFVPTMGALHKGHLSLIEEAKSNNDFVISSIFVNPSQFNDQKDLINYPRMPEQDISLLEEVGCNAVFIPSVTEIYPQGYVPLNIDFGQLATTMEGAFRPGHFVGMATVVNRLMDIVQPNNAYFGEKDFQQLAIIKNMALQLKYNTKIHGCKTLREEDGLAMSSRNLLLSSTDRKAASIIYKALSEAQSFIPFHQPAAIVELVKRRINAISSFQVQYFQLVNEETLEDITNWDKIKSCRACIAVLTSGPRLIDNIQYQIE